MCNAISSDNAVSIPGSAQSYCNFVLSGAPIRDFLRHSFRRARNRAHVREAMPGVRPRLLRPDKGTLAVDFNDFEGAETRLAANLA
ncbi:hypothetical protein GCM10007857_70830 [Bradyrhizobium iriomotense]|uniref:Uncharacterized protein n=1 Tax=Bradyrhizobium iriomotense TaxID=441950 RepID=A0ABQ6BDX4_9BRAD|nr:hypothetical protein GCM10007857_70830 [Bradyrhizobium iriomotense]